MTKIIIIAGPTASGKTNFGIKLAKKLQGEVINADSMQVYAENPIISGQPTMEERQNVPHHLFGYVNGNEDYTVAKWIEDAVSKINNIKKLPILVGGTGFYLKHLMFGLSAIPDTSKEIRQQAHDLLDNMGNTAFHQLLMQMDLESASNINPNNTKRVLRAYEVFKSTGKPIHHWQKQNISYFPQSSFQLIVLLPPREIIYNHCNQRFLDMLDRGAIEEVKYLLKQNYNPISGVMKSHGIPELSKYLAGEWNLNEAIQKSQQMVRNYAKRQITWFKHQFKFLEVEPYFIENPEEEFDKALDLCKKFIK